ncbi:hypothetical protein H6G96_37500 [Nostoc sp. FACHB-892]|uniref:hypothetical protein n=1 Tax=Nostoc sp. FACHB-892 TaxID=2692843 RepID=UPI001688EE11|nr:hypothetical protein [Nostoc sp. FACHB-892]MBD2731821.1 hypothetical protein [Nostoc sp. FACHB-892]
MPEKHSDRPVITLYQRLQPMKFYSLLAAMSCMALIFASTPASFASNPHQPLTATEDSNSTPKPHRGQGRRD